MAWLKSLGTGILGGIAGAAPYLQTLASQDLRRRDILGAQLREEISNANERIRSRYLTPEQAAQEQQTLLSSPSFQDDWAQEIIKRADFAPTPAEERLNIGLGMQEPHEVGEPFGVFEQRASGVRLPPTMPGALRGTALPEEFDIRSPDGEAFPMVIPPGLDPAQAGMLRPLPSGAVERAPITEDQLGRATETFGEIPMKEFYERGQPSRVAAATAAEKQKREWQAELVKAETVAGIEGKLDTAGKVLTADLDRYAAMSQAERTEEWNSLALYRVQKGIDHEMAVALQTDWRVIEAKAELSNRVSLYQHSLEIGKPFPLWDLETEKPSFWSWTINQEGVRSLHRVSPAGMGDLVPIYAAAGLKDDWLDILLKDMMVMTGAKVGDNIDFSDPETQLAFDAALPPEMANLTPEQKKNIYDSVRGSAFRATPDRDGISVDSTTGIRLGPDGLPVTPGGEDTLDLGAARALLEGLPGGGGEVLPPGVQPPPPETLTAWDQGLLPGDVQILDNYGDDRSLGPPSPTALKPLEEMGFYQGMPAPGEDASWWLPTDSGSQQQVGPFTEVEALTHQLQEDRKLLSRMDAEHQNMEENARLAANGQQWVEAHKAETFIRENPGSSKTTRAPEYRSMGAVLDAQVGSLRNVPRPGYVINVPRTTPAQAKANVAAYEQQAGQLSERLERFLERRRQLETMIEHLGGFVPPTRTPRIRPDYGQ